MTRLVYFFIGLFERFPHSLHALIARIVVGLVFWNSGRTKVAGWDIFLVSDKTLLLFREEYRLPLIPPETAALMAQISEHVLSVLLIIGLASRFAALGLLVMTLVIEIFVYPDAYIIHGLWATALILIMKFGPGSLSVDHLIRTRG